MSEAAVVATGREFEQWMTEHSPAPAVLDIETFGTNLADPIHGMGLKRWKLAEAGVYVLDQALTEAGHHFRSWLKDAGEVHNHSLPFDLTHLQHWHNCIPLRDLKYVDVRNLATLAKRAVYDNTPNTLDSLAKDINPESGKDSEIADWLKANKLKKWEYARAPLALVSKYCLQDLRLVEETEGKWMQHCIDLNMMGTVELEHQMIPLIVDMQVRGLLLDLDFVHKAIDVLSAEQNILLGQLKAIADINWSPNSNDLEKFLVDGLHLELITSPKFNDATRKWEQKTSLDKAARAMYVKEYPEHTRLFSLIGGWVRVSTILNYYTTYASQHVDGIIHPRFNSLGARTGRGSSSGPNFQNLSHRDEGESLYYEVKNAIVARPGFRIVTADYSQAELRLLLHYIRIFDDRIQDLIDKIHNGADMHAATAAAMYRIPLEEVTPELRRKGKTINFGTIYGQGITSLAKGLGVSKDEGKVLQEAYFEGLPGIKELLKRLKHKARTKGHVTTLFGRRVGIAKKKPYVALNYVCQGGVGEGCKKAMIELWEDPPCPEYKILFQVHDDIPCEIPEDLALNQEQMFRFQMDVERRMLRPFRGLHIDFTVDVSEPQERWAE